MSNNSSIHHKFLGQGTDGDCQVEYSIEVMPDSRHEEAVKFMVDHFMGINYLYFLGQFKYAFPINLNNVSIH